MHLSRPVAILMVTLAAAPAAAQRSAWRVRTALTADLRYDTNPFRLTASNRRDVNAPSAAEIGSGRFADMENASDLILVPGVELRLSRGNLDVEILATYDANLQNGRRRHAEARVTLDRSRSGHRLRARADWRPAYFSKNYLIDAVDTNGDFAITPDERRYAPGVSNELDLLVSYRRRFSKASKRRPLGASLELGLTWLDRAYRDPFPGRDRGGPGALAGLTLAGRRWTAHLDYAVAALGADATREVLLLDEPEFTRDFNGNGNTTDLDARAFELVDRSCTEHEVSLAVRGEMADNMNAELAYGRRIRAFGSDQPFDVNGRGREDTRDEIAAALTVAVNRNAAIVFSLRRITQDTNREGDPGSTGAVTDYTRHTAGVAVRYRL